MKHLPEPPIGKSHVRETLLLVRVVEPFDTFERDNDLVFD